MLGLKIYSPAKAGDFIFKEHFPKPESLGYSRVSANADEDVRARKAHALPPAVLTSSCEDAGTRIRMRAQTHQCARAQKKGDSQHETDRFSLNSRGDSNHRGVH